MVRATTEVAEVENGVIRGWRTKTLQGNLKPRRAQGPNYFMWCSQESGSAGASSPKIRLKLASRISKAPPFCMPSHKIVKLELPGRCTLWPEGFMVEKAHGGGLPWRMASREGDQQKTRYGGMKRRWETKQGPAEAGSLRWSRRWSSSFWPCPTLPGVSHPSWESALGNINVICVWIVWRVHTESSRSSDLCIAV